MSSHPHVRDNQQAHRFELDVEGAVAFADYRRAGRVVTITHTEVPRTLRGKGVGARLVKGVLDLLREHDEKVVPACDFVQSYIDTNPAYRDLLAT